MRARVRTRGRTLLVGGVIASLIAVSGCSAAAPDPDGGAAQDGAGAASVFPDPVVAPLADALPQRTITPLPPARLADGLIPPTNRWFSGLVFGDQSMPVFPMPLSFQLTESGFELGLPNVSTQPKVIMGGFVGDIAADVGADTQVVTAYDEASVTIGQSAGGVELGSTIIAQGSPFVSFTAAAPVDVRLGTAFQPVADGVFRVKIQDTEYGLVTSGMLAPDGSRLSLAAGQVASWFAVADGAELADFVDAARQPVVGTSLEYSLDGETATTGIRYRTADGSPTLVATMPHQTAASCTPGSYPSIYGTLGLCSTSMLEWSVPRLTPSGSLDLSGISDDERARLREQVAADVASTGTFAADTYFGGKSLYRAVNLLDVARQVGADAAAADLQVRLVDALDEWMSPDGCVSGDERCFVYDPQARGLVGLATSFGSDEFNDHHFHYGYFLYAAGVLAADDPALVERWAPVMDLLAADIATSGESTYFPQRRVFDAYAGHSWASGTSQFGDGNNQESSSEAVNAWNGLALWAAASDQPELEAEATWMLSAEAASARAYWTDFDLDDPLYDGFGYTVTSLVWGGKRDYATWFSAEPSAMLGILVLPFSPVSGYLGGDPGRIRANLADAAPNGFDVMFGDYLLMYSALAGPEDAAAALETASTLNEDRIDDGNSRSYLLAYLMTLR